HGVLTESLLVVGTDRGPVEGVVGRILGESNGSLSENADLRAAFDGRAHGTFFAYADLQRLLKSAKRYMSERDREEIAQVNAFADLATPGWVTVAAGIVKGISGGVVRLRLAAHHHSLLCNFLRRAPMRRKCLANVPGDAAAVIGVGLNPPMRVVEG